MSGVDIFGTEQDISIEKKNEILTSIKSIVAKYTLCDESWTEAITSQYFLVNLAFELDMTRDNSFRELLNIFLGSFSPQFDGGYRMNERNILIIPDENQKLIECMKKEDAEDPYYTGALSADKITDPDKIYHNYLYGIMINIANATGNAAFKNVFEHCIKELLSDSAVDKIRGGWVHYRLPWITARIVLGLHNVLKHDRFFIDGELYRKIENHVNKALDSLIDRIYQQKYWRSGAGDWVSMWQSTGLCLEAFIEAKDWSINSEYIPKINNVIKYLFESDVISEWLPDSIDLSNDESVTQTLDQIVLCSVLYRYLNYGTWQKYAHYKKDIGDFFDRCIKQLTVIGKINGREFCTMPQILYYVAKAIRSK